MSAAPRLSSDDRDILYPDQWMLSFSGRRFWPLHLRAGDVCITDIAHALSIEPRFGGHTKYSIGYPVAQHAVFVASLVARRTTDPRIVFAALHHDSHEAFLKDIPSPIKRALGQELIKPAERAADAAIAEALGIEQSLLYHPLVRSADLIALVTEKRDLCAFHAPSDSVKSEEVAVAPDERVITPMPSESAKWEFLRWHDDLCKALGKR